MKTHKRDLAKPSFWQFVFMQSKVNGAVYDGERLPQQKWSWPKNTYFQHRLLCVKWYQSSDNSQWN